MVRLRRDSKYVTNKVREFYQKEQEKIVKSQNPGNGQKTEDERDLEKEFDNLFEELRRLEEDEKRDDEEAVNPCLPGDIDSDCYYEDGRIKINRKGEYVLLDEAEDWGADPGKEQCKYYDNPPEKELLVAYYGFYDDGSQTKLYVRIDDADEAEEVIRRYKEIDRPVPIWNHAKALCCVDDGKELAVWNTEGASWHTPKERYEMSQN